VAPAPKYIGVFKCNPQKRFSDVLIYIACERFIMSLVSRVDSPTTLSDAFAILSDRERPIRIIAGGTDLMVLMNAHQLDASQFLNIWGVEELRGITEEDDIMRIGALTTYTQLIRSGPVRQFLPALVAASRTIGAIQIQNRGTIGGNIVNASPAGDTLPVLAAYESEIEIGSADGIRRVPFQRVLHWVPCYCFATTRIVAECANTET
jgi:CO/xanthine dehydrogenase FAD-binding subunit